MSEITTADTKNKQTLGYLHIKVKSGQHIWSGGRKEMLTCGKGQQAHCPEFILQQVEPHGHLVFSSHFSSSTSKVRAATFVSQETGGEKPRGSSQVSAARLQTLLWGQQWMWSSQQTACRYTQYRPGVLHRTTRKPCKPIDFFFFFNLQM